MEKAYKMVVKIKYDQTGKAKFSTPWRSHMLIKCGADVLQVRSPGKILTADAVSVEFANPSSLPWVSWFPLQPKDMWVYRLISLCKMALNELGVNANGWSMTSVDLVGPKVWFHAVYLN